VDEPGYGFLVQSGNPALDEVTVREGDRIVTLRMREGKVIPATAEPAVTKPVAPTVAARRQPGDPRAPRDKPGA
jgi:hypothetical protein